MFSFAQSGPEGGYNDAPVSIQGVGAQVIEAGDDTKTLVLSVINNFATNAYDSFAEVTDADAIASLATATITFTSTNKGGAHSIVYKAVSSGGRADIFGTWNISVVDTTAPVLSLPTDIKAGQTTGTIGATTNEGSAPYGANGTMYVVASTSSTAPTAAQIKLGLMHTGAAAAAAASVAVSTTGVKTVGVTGLTAGTAYFGHIAQFDSSLNASNVVTGDGFTTDP